MLSTFWRKHDFFQWQLNCKECFFKPLHVAVSLKRGKDYQNQYLEKLLKGAPGFEPRISGVQPEKQESVKLLRIPGFEPVNSGVQGKNCTTSPTLWLTMLSENLVRDRYRSYQLTHWKKRFLKHGTQNCAASSPHLLAWFHASDHWNL